MPIAFEELEIAKGWIDISDNCDRQARTTTRDVTATWPGDVALSKIKHAMLQCLEGVRTYGANVRL